MRCDVRRCVRTCSFDRATVVSVERWPPGQRQVSQASWRHHKIFVVKQAMDDSVGTSIMASKRKKCYRSVEERRQIVEEALVPGASVSTVARAHGVNTNLVFHWR